MQEPVLAGSCEQVIHRNSLTVAVLPSSLSKLLTDLIALASSSPTACSLSLIPRLTRSIFFPAYMTFKPCNIVIDFEHVTADYIIYTDLSTNPLHL